MKISGALFACIFALGSPLLGREKDKTLPQEALHAVEARAASVVSQIRPASAKERGLRRMQLKEGWLYWGSPFDPDEVVAFTSLQEGQTSDQASIYPPTHLCYFTWIGGQWKQRQYLGHGKELDMHTRNGGKEHYLQALSIKGKYEADQHSWRYDPKTRKLEPTGLDGWGRYWIAGDYVCYPRGWERLAHDSAVWVYQFQDGKKAI